MVSIVEHRKSPSFEFETTVEQLDHQASSSTRRQGLQALSAMRAGAMASGKNKYGDSYAVYELEHDVDTHGVAGAWTTSSASTAHLPGPWFSSTSAAAPTTSSLVDGHRAVCDVSHSANGKLDALRQLECTQEQGSAAWLKARASLATASDAATLRQAPGAKTLEKLISRKVALSQGSHVPTVSTRAMQYGSATEGKVIELIKLGFGLDVHRFGLVKSASYPGWAASPDGVISCSSGDVALLEIKCAYPDPRQSGARRPLKPGAVKAVWYHQVQFALHALQISRALFAEFFGTKLHVVNVARSEVWLAENKSKIDRSVQLLSEALPCTPHLALASGGGEMAAMLVPGTPRSSATLASPAQTPNPVPEPPAPGPVASSSKPLNHLTTRSIMDCPRALTAAYPTFANGGLKLTAIRAASDLFGAAHEFEGRQVGFFKHGQQRKELSPVLYFDNQTCADKWAGEVLRISFASKNTSVMGGQHCKALVNEAGEPNGRLEPAARKVTYHCASCLASRGGSADDDTSHSGGQRRKPRRQKKRMGQGAACNACIVRRDHIDGSTSFTLQDDHSSTCTIVNNTTLQRFPVSVVREVGELAQRGHTVADITRLYNERIGLDLDFDLQRVTSSTTKTRGRESLPQRQVAYIVRQLQLTAATKGQWDKNDMVSSEILLREFMSKNVAVAYKPKGQKLVPGQPDPRECFANELDFPALAHLDEDTFLLVLFPKFGRDMFRDFGTAVYVDATFNLAVNYDHLQTITANIVDNTGTAVPVAVCISNFENQDVFRAFFNVILTHVPDRVPDVLVSDLAEAAYLGFLRTGRNPGLRWIYCSFHLFKAMREYVSCKLPQGTLCAEEFQVAKATLWSLVLKLFNARRGSKQYARRRAPTADEFQRTMSAISQHLRDGFGYTEHSAPVRYFQRYFEQQERWSPIVREQAKAEFHLVTLPSTNAVSESTFRVLKKSDMGFAGKHNGRLDGLLTVLGSFFRYTLQNIVDRLSGTRTTSLPFAIENDANFVRLELKALDDGYDRDAADGLVIGDERLAEAHMEQLRILEGGHAESIAAEVDDEANCTVGDVDFGPTPGEEATDAPDAVGEPAAAADVSALEMSVEIIDPPPPEPHRARPLRPQAMEARKIATQLRELAAKLSAAADAFEEQHGEDPCEGYVPTRSDELAASVLREKRYSLALACNTIGRHVDIAVDAMRLDGASASSTSFHSRDVAPGRPRVQITQARGAVRPAGAIPDPVAAAVSRESGDRLAQPLAVSQPPRKRARKERQIKEVVPEELINKQPVPRAAIPARREVSTARRETPMLVARIEASSRLAWRARHTFDDDTDYERLREEEVAKLLATHWSLRLRDQGFPEEDLELLEDVGYTGRVERVDYPHHGKPGLLALPAGSLCVKLGGSGNGFLYQYQGEWIAARELLSMHSEFAD